MIVFFVIFGLIGLGFFNLGNILAEAKFKQGGWISIKTPETLSDPNIWQKVNRLGAKYYKQTGLGFILLGIASIILARGVIAIFIFLGMVALMIFLLWRVNQLEKYAVELYKDKQNKLLTQKDQQDKD